MSNILFNSYFCIYSFSLLIYLIYFKYIMIKSYKVIESHNNEYYFL
jgi:hypothetical protein